MEELQDTQVGPIHVSLKQADNVIDPARYRLLIREWKFTQNEKTGNTGVNITFAFDAQRHEKYAKRTLYETCWLTPEAIFRYNNLLVCAGINLELLREVPLLDEAGNEQVDEDGNVITQCAHSVKDQMDSIVGAAIFADIQTNEYTAKAADGVTDVKKKNSRIAKFVKA